MKWNNPWTLALFYIHNFQWSHIIKHSIVNKQVEKQIPKPPEDRISSQPQFICGILIQCFVATCSDNKFYFVSKLEHASFKKTSQLYCTQYLYTNMHP